MDPASYRYRERCRHAACPGAISDQRQHLGTRPASPEGICKSWGKPKAKSNAQMRQRRAVLDELVVLERGAFHLLQEGEDRIDAVERRYLMSAREASSKRNLAAAVPHRERRKILDRIQRVQGRHRLAQLSHHPFGHAFYRAGSTLKRPRKVRSFRSGTYHHHRHQHQPHECTRRKS